TGLAVGQHAVNLAVAEIVTTHQRQDVTVFRRHRDDSTLQFRYLPQLPVAIGTATHADHITHAGDIGSALGRWPGIVATDKRACPFQTCPGDGGGGAVTQHYVNGAIMHSGDYGRNMVAVVRAHSQFTQPAIANVVAAGRQTCFGSAVAVATYVVVFQTIGQGRGGCILLVPEYGSGDCETKAVNIVPV